MAGGWWSVVSRRWAVVGGCWLVVGGWWLVVGGWWSRRSAPYRERRCSPLSGPHRTPPNPTPPWPPTDSTSPFKGLRRGSTGRGSTGLLAAACPPPLDCGENRRFRAHTELHQTQPRLRLPETPRPHPRASGVARRGLLASPLSGPHRTPLNPPRLGISSETRTPCSVESSSVEVVPYAQSIALEPRDAGYKASRRATFEPCCAAPPVVNRTGGESVFDRVLVYVV